MSTVSKKWTKAIRRDRTLLDITLEKRALWKKGKQVFLTVENPSNRQTNKSFARVPATDVWGKYLPYQIRSKSEDEL